MNTSAATEAPAPAVAWSEQLTSVEAITLVGLPIASFVLIYILLRIVWKPLASNPKYSLPLASSVPHYGATTGATTSQGSPIEEGEVAGDYEDHWTKTFDFVFLIGMVLYLAVVVALTWVYSPEYFTTPLFWWSQLPKVGCMMIVSMIGGLICRMFCSVDSNGYIITNKSSAFKVNYTRKLQHFAAYMVPLVMHTNFHGPLALAWGDFFTMIGFLVLIKPVRESLSFFMLQFNSLDRPEDRPHTLKWIIAGNIAPGLFILMFFKWLFAENGDLVYIIVFITGIGDGLAEPVGIMWGKHKYKTTACFSTRAYTRSWEGSTCVFLSGMIFPALQYADFDSFAQVLVSMIVLPPTMAYAEAIAPHTMDTPVLMIGCGIILWVITTFV
ncbi:hypothetical protein H310_12284 [Aphanomyces invadans]|uniref:Dolichol kinase n=1 Tax=Aphanomyces invadans TaxID=157072 RepID=A0A024TJ08_9STRA|nr:hypothetical protein H310_12284 [Aphanomyces invadans]ETV93949.1 hypothetical protein H310_12284 [Aphanomyces invadans]|eukprot:XP_008877509.1 hypothetical protein H310_12284 [Aphanomyces invadans]